QYSGSFGTAADETILRVIEDPEAGTIAIYRQDGKDPIVTQNARPDFRPYLHPIVAPDGQGLVTEYSPGHHKHQTGLYWGFTRVNGRDFFHHPEGDYWQKESAQIIDSVGEQVKWQTVYHLLNEEGTPVLVETQSWSMREIDNKYLLDLEWKGEAKTEITIGEYDYGGLFLRMPWKEGIAGEVVNAARQRNQNAEGQRAMWVDVGLQVEGRDDLVHMAILDHPNNEGYPQSWRVDNQMGVGPVRARMGDWQIVKGETETIRHQMVVYTGELDDLAMTQTWGDFSGKQGMYSTTSLWDIAQQEGRQAKFLSPQEAVDNMTIGDDYQVNAWAAEPMITQPMAFCWDDRGRLWIAENRDYETRSTGFSNFGDSRILILEDTDGDGSADSKKVFLEGIPFPAAIAVGFDGLFLGAPPNLLFVPDTDQDDKADVDDIEVRLTGWGIRDRHETINSLHWGPDGWLYGLEGFATPSKIRKPNGKGRIYKHREAFPQDLLEGPGVDVNGGVWRYHPTKDRFEVVAHGFSNPWGIDYDAKGQMFISACVIPHLFHVVPGGIYHRQGGQHFNPYVYSDIQTIVNHRHRSAHGGARVYLSDAFPKEQQGRIFMANIHEHAVLSDVLEPNGSGFVAHHGEDFMLANNAQWIGFSMEIGPEGALYVLDWHDADICGKEVMNKETGRVFRIMPKQSAAKDWEGRYSDLTKMTDLQLAELQMNESVWHARRARVILQYRASKGEVAPEALEKLRSVFETNQNQDWRLRALWALHVTKSLSTDELQKSLSDDDQYVRAWAIQLLCEDGSPSEVARTKFAQMANDDASAVVRLYLAAALQRFPEDQRWDIANGLMSRATDAEDHNIPKMIWFAVEPLVAVDPERSLKLAADSEIPLVAEFIARRAVDGNKIETLIAGLGRQPKTTVQQLKGMLSGLEGRSDLETPAVWEEVYAKLKSNSQAAPLALQVAQQFGDAEAAKQLLVRVKNKNASPKDRQESLRQLADQKWPELLEELPGFLRDPDLRIEAIRAAAAFNNEDLGWYLVEQYPKYSQDERLELVQAMASRSQYGWV
ncbi:MAG: PVC-type heme-binding CxxCH protein, partial [Cyclobacteriaceae bacterium]